MKRFVIFLISICTLMFWMTGCAPAATVESTPTPIPATPTLSPMDAIGKLHWFGTSSFLYHGSLNIYFDPVTLDGNLPPADLILVTHGHSDHWSVADLKKVIGPDTVLIIGPNVSSSFEAAKDDLGITAQVLNEGEKTEVKGVSIEAVPAYDTTFHLKGTGGVGFIVTVDGVRIYHAGGTAAYPEMAGYTCDIALIPSYSRDLTHALAEIIPAKVIIFQHTTYYAAKALSDLFATDISGKTFVALEAGPYQP